MSAGHPFAGIVPANDANRDVAAMAQRLMTMREEATGHGCWSGGYPGRDCDGMAFCRCANEAEADAARILRDEVRIGAPA